MDVIPTPAQSASELVRELRRIRLTLFAGVCVAAGFFGLRITDAVIRPPAPNWQELYGIQTELRMLREELSRQRLANPLPPFIQPVPKVIGVVNPDQKGKE